MTQTTEKNTHNLQAQVSEIEANLAFFEARFALIEHRPDTAYKRAQLKAYEAMQKQLNKQLKELLLQHKLRQARQKKS